MANNNILEPTEIPTEYSKRRPEVATNVCY